MSTPASGARFDTEPRHPGWPAKLGPLGIAAGTLTLRPIRLRDAGAWSRTRIRDRGYLEQWEPTASGGWDDRNAPLAWPAQWSALRGLARRGQCLPFTIVLDGVFAGQITLGNVIRASLRSAWVGYWVSAELAGGGVATGAVALAVDHAFAAASLHRVEATVRPENLASIRVLNKAGFREEGLFQRYLDVAGDWRDHLCFAITREDVELSVTSKLISAGVAWRV